MLWSSNPDFRCKHICSVDVGRKCLRRDGCSFGRLFYIRNTECDVTFLDAGIVGQIAKDNGLTPKVSQSLQSKIIDHIDQTNESDINF